MNEVNEANQEKKPNFAMKGLRDAGIFLVCVLIFVFIMATIGVKNMSSSEFGYRIGKAAAPAVFAVGYLSYTIRKLLYKRKNNS